jgi:putative transposase
MPWKETCPMDERMKFIADYLQDEWSLSVLCRHYGISRKTGYKWLARYRTDGPSGLMDRHRAPRRHPNAIPQMIQDRIVAFRVEHPHWGPRKLVYRLAQLEPDIRWPASSTVGEILKRHGLIAPRRRRRHTPPYARPFHEGLQPNDVWSADFKGWFRTRCGTRIDPLTIADTASRYLLRCQALMRPTRTTVQAVFTAAFQEYGLPVAIRTDNGPPFASTGLGGLSQLSVWWLRLGITPERIRPGHPEENGRHERMHRTLKQATARPPQATPKDQQDAFDRFRTEYNQERPHEALEMQTPAQHYQASPRHFPDRVPEMEYPPEYQVRRVRSNGQIRWQGRLIFLSEVLIGQRVGLHQIDNGLWHLNFGPVPLALYDEKTKKFSPIQL